MKGRANGITSATGTIRWRVKSVLIWLVTVRATDGNSHVVDALLVEQIMPLLRASPGCTGAALARCVNCVGERTYLAYWTDLGAVEALEVDPEYRRVVDELAAVLGVPPKRELWEVMSL